MSQLPTSKTAKRAAKDAPRKMYGRVEAAIPRFLEHHARNRIALSIKEVGKLMGASRTWLNKQIRTGRLITHKSGRRRFVLLTELNAFLASLENSQGGSNG